MSTTASPRGFVASFDKASGRFTVYTGGQSTFGQKMATAEVLKVTPDKVHALLGNVGGSFGMKAPVFPEYVCVLHATRELGRPVRFQAALLVLLAAAARARIVAAGLWHSASLR